MTDSITSDRALRAAQFALDGLSTQQELIGQNLANVDTPGYRAQTADFQATLRQALDNGSGGLSPVSMQVTQAGHQRPSAGETNPIQFSMRQGGSVRADGNNVDIDVELSQMAETGIQYQAISQLVSKKLLMLKNIINGR